MTDDPLQARDAQAWRDMINAMQPTYAERGTRLGMDCPECGIDYLESVPLVALWIPKKYEDDLDPADPVRFRAVNGAQCWQCGCITSVEAAEAVRLANVAFGKMEAERDALRETIVEAMGGKR